jgi:hypothetical protein
MRARKAWVLSFSKNKRTDSLKPIAYFNRCTTPAEKFYHSFELETLAVVEALKRFSFYLLELHFTIVTVGSRIYLFETRPYSPYYSMVASSAAI